MSCCVQACITRSNVRPLQDSLGHFFTLIFHRPKVKRAGPSRDLGRPAKQQTKRLPTNNGNTTRNNSYMSSVPPPSAAAAAAAAATAAAVVAGAAPAAAPIFASSGVSNDADDDGDLRKVPFFTAEEELQELASLTISDIAKIQSDLSGLSSVLASSAAAAAASGLGGAAASLSAQAVGIAQTNIELSRLPPSDTAAYSRAVERCPNEAGPDKTHMFLEAENHDPRAAAVKLAKYWESRVALFGEDRAYLPMTLAGAMKDEAMNLATRRIWQLLPATDTAGRAILLMTPARRNYAEYSIEQEFVSCLCTSAHVPYE